jgi:hypothetical protein
MGGNMTFQATVYRVLVVAPDDVTAELKTIQRIISSWNTKYSAKMKAVFLPVSLETHSVHETGDRPQATLSKQIIRDCDILIGVFWTRIGTETGLAESITMEEIGEFQKAGKPVMLYLSSAPAVPGSVDLKQFGKLMKLMDECNKQGLVSGYDSIPDFREKLSTQIVSKIMKIHKTPEVETHRDSRETAKKELTVIISNRFCDLIERYYAKWTSEKKIKPINLDDGRKIITDLTREISGSKESLAKIFSKEKIELIDQIISNLTALQKHRLYLDRKSYTDFWKSGDEIFASLDSIAGMVRKSKNIPKIDH